MSHYLEVNGIRATSAFVQVPGGGRWVASVDLDGTDEIPTAQNAAVLTIGQTTFRGTYDVAHSGTFGLRRRLQIVGGAGWERVVAPRAEHNDAGIKLSQILQKLAQETGEVVANIPDRVLGIKYVRGATTATSHLIVLLDAWHVDYEGVTQCRAPQGGPLGEYELLEYDPRAKTAVIATLDPKAVLRGATLVTRLDAPLVVRSLSISVEAESARITVWGT